MYIRILITVISFSLLLGCVGPDGQVDESSNKKETSSGSSAEGTQNDTAMQEFKTTESGLKYRVIEPGAGPKPAPESIVQVHYRGWLPDKRDPSTGKEFDSSLGREPVTFPLNGVIPGWTEGLQLIGAGGKMELEIPPQLAYGEQGMGPIPGNATLRFEVQLIDVIQPPKPVEPGPTDPDAAQEFSQTVSGLQYRILRKGNGPSPAPTDEVTVHYRGWLPDENDPSTGKVFDSSYERGDTTSFRLNQVIPGWTEGLQLVQEGGMIELHIPSELGYGQTGSSGAIPPNADLRFLVELMDIAN